MNTKLKKFAKHLPHYIPLLGLFGFVVLTFVLFSYDILLLGIVVVSASIFYVLWGIIHHYIHKDLYVSVVVEYILVASLGLIIIFSLLS